MPYLSLESFKFGLDARRSELSTVPGALIAATNGHINTGGEFEKRLAFVNLSSTGLPTGTFGLQSTDAGLLTFGSIADPGGWPIAGVAAYQRLQHPAVLDGAFYNGTYHAMTAVVWSKPFLGKAFVTARFADGNVFEYYDGVLVEQSRHGLVLRGWATNPNLATSLAATLSGVTGFHSSATSNTVDIWSDFGVDYVPSVDEFVSAAGVVSIIKVSDTTPGIAGSAAIGRFQVIAFSTTGSITTITVNGVQINADPIPCTGLTTVTQVAAAIVAEINESVSSPKYTATSEVGTVFISADPDAGTTPNNFAVVITTTKVCIGLGASALPTGAADGDNVSSITAGATEILGATITKAGTVTSWATAVAAQIVTFNTAYTAVSVGEVVYISKKVTSSADANVTLTFTLSAGSVISNPPATPTDILVSFGLTNIDVQWTLVTGATNYNIFRSTSLQGTYTQVGTVADPTNLFQDFDVVLEARYFYRVTAVNSVGESALSHIAFTTNTSTALANISPVAHDTTIEIATAVQPYQLFKGNSPGTMQYFVSFTGPTYSDTAVVAAIPYYYQVHDLSGGLGPVMGAMLNGALPIAPFTVQLSKLSVQGNSTSSQNDILVTSEAVKVIASGGVSPKTYAWIEVNNPNHIYPTDPNGHDTQFRVSVPKGQTYFATFRCLVTGGAGHQEFSPTVTITLGHIV